MKTTRNSTLIVFALIISFNIIAQQEFCLTLQTATADGVNYEVDIYMSGDPGTFSLGSSNLQFTFDGTDMDNPTLVSSEITPLLASTDYITNVTRPTGNKVSLNIFKFSPFSAGLNIPASPAMVKLARIHFDVLDASATTNLVWSYTGLSTETVVFMADEVTQMFSTCLEDLVGDFLPIDLATFDAFPRENLVHLEWTSASEFNFFGYELQRSIDGIVFDPIGWIPSKGKENFFTKYDFDDWNILYNQNLYYRLKLVEQNDGINYSEIRTARIDRINENGIFINPNPVSDWTKVEVLCQDCLSGEIQLVNINGQIIREEKIFFNGNLGELNLNIADLAPGVYLIRIKAGMQNFGTKLIKQ